MKTRNTSSMLTKAIVPVRDSLSRSAWRRGILLIALVLASFAVLPAAQAVCRDGCDATNTFLGEDALLSNTTGFSNTATGDIALTSNTTGTNNTADGSFSLYSNTEGNLNTATGSNALASNETGSDNTANGAYALANNTTGEFNTAIGLEALYSNQTGGSNTANGAIALFSNETGFNNTAIGHSALYSNTSGSSNTASGVEALHYNTTGGNNTANGYQALNGDSRIPSTGSNNTANGAFALNKNTTGYFNAANGESALFSNTTGYDNSANGARALVNNTTGLKNTANGAFALYSNTTGSSNIALGFLAGTSLTTGSNNIDIGNSGLAGEAKTIRIGALRIQANTYIAGINGVTVPNGVGVIVDSTGHLGTVVSSERFKDAIKPMDKASEAILSLHPVTFRYKKDLDPDSIPQFGLVAEQVAKVNPDLVARDDQGKPYTVRYEAVNAMLLNEFLKEHRKGQEQDATIAQLKSAVAQQRSTNADQQKAIQALTASLKEQATQIEKVNAQLAASDQSLPRIVVNDQSTTR
jgi:uncharacterized coiled-coil protein SlyX